MRIVDVEQGSDAWHNWRLKKITGSRLASIWSARQYTVKDIENLLIGRGFDLSAFQKELNEKRKESGQKAKKYTKADLEAILTEDDKAFLSSDSTKKKEFYQLLADQFAISWDDDEVKYRSPMDRGTELEPEAMMTFAQVFNKELVVVGGIESDVDPRIANSPDRLVKPTRGKIYREAVEGKCLDAAKHFMAYFERRIPEEYWTQNVQYFVTNEKLERLYWVFYNPRIPLLPMFCLVVERADLGHWPETMLKYQLRTLAEIDTLRDTLLATDLLDPNNLMLRAKTERGVENDVPTTKS